MVVEDRKRRIRRTDIVGKSSITDNRNSRFDILHGISEEGDNIDQVSYVSSTVIPGSNAMHRAVTILEEGEGVESSDNLGPPVVVVDEGHDGILEMEHSGKKHGPSLVEA
ncbi:hypothetical protein V6N12_060915 [Hibiscus sabdariffa]|uniref:Uncharacterized protein n=1 Tax=Hibiscus sabdariffa TaxID=183260 RepID=A0ABR2DVZ4_9ROSI